MRDNKLSSKNSVWIHTWFMPFFMFEEEEILQ